MSATQTKEGQYRQQTLFDGLCLAEPGKRERQATIQERFETFDRAHPEDGAFRRFFKLRELKRE